MDPRSFKILEFLYPKGTHNNVDISPVLLEFYPDVNKMDESTISYSGLIVRLLLGMRTSGLINYADFSLGGGNRSNGYTWLDSTPINVSITEIGMKALDEEKRRPLLDRITDLTITTNNSIIETNNSIILTDTSVRQLNRLLKWSNVISLIISAALLAFIALTYVRDAKKAPSQTNTQSKQTQLLQDKQPKTQAINPPAHLKADSTRR